MDTKELYNLSEQADIILQSDNNKNLNDIIIKLKPIISEIKQGSIGIAQINTIPGNIEYNAKKIIKYIAYATKLGLDMIIFPKHALTGFPLEDAFDRFPNIKNEADKWEKEILKQTTTTEVILGESDSKCVNNIKYAFSNDFNDVKAADISIVCCPKTSYEDKEAYVKKSSIYVNQVGAVDSISFDGASCVYNKNGELIARAKSFEEQFLIVNPKMNIGKIYPVPYKACKSEFSLNYDDEMERTYKIVIQGIKDYFHKNGIKRACLGLSGGLDSTVCAVVLVDALGKENVFGISMPSKISSIESKTDAEELASNLGINYTVMPIKDIVSTTDAVFKDLFDNVETKWNCRYKKSFTMDNIQARTRAMYLWGIANEFESCIPIATSDKSEAYMGYATINGDMSGGYAPIADITKTKLFAFARWLNNNRAEKNVIPESVLLKKPGAELAIDEKTGKLLTAEDALMPYEFLDEVIWRIENKHESYYDMINSKFLYEKNHKLLSEEKIQWLDKFFKRMTGALYKGSIMPPYIVVDTPTINKNFYKQPISSKINYKSLTEEEIRKKLKDFAI